MLGRAFSPFLRMAFQSIHTLHLLDYSISAPLPKFPRGCSKGLTNVVLHFADTWRGNWITLQPMLQALGASNLYIRLTEPHIASLTGDALEPTIYRLPRCFRRVTLLVPNACRLGAAPACIFQLDDTTVEREVSIVLLPWDHKAHGDLHAMVNDHWLDSTHSCPPIQRPTLFTGAEYTGCRTDLKWMFFPYPYPGTDPSGVNSVGGGDKTSRANLRFQTFAEWIDGVDPETIFSIKEHRELWLQDIRLCSADWERRFHRLRHDMVVSLSPPY